MNNQLIGWIQIIVGALIFLWNLLSSIKNEILSSQLIEMLGDEWATISFFQNIAYYLSFIKWVVFGVALMIILQGIINIRSR